MHHYHLRPRNSNHHEKSHKKCRKPYSNIIVREYSRPTTFDELTDDIHLQVFKYLKARDCIVFEQVNRKWKSLLEIGWRSRKVLAFGNRRYEKSYEALCSNPDHKIFRRDFFSVRSIRIRLLLVKRCINLRVLVWDRLPSGSVGSALNNCKNIEHIDGLHDVAFLSIANVNNTITCIRSRAGVRFALSLRPRVFGVSALHYGIADTRYMDLFYDTCDSVRHLYWPNFNVSQGNLYSLLDKLPNVATIRSKGTYLEQTVQRLPPHENIVILQPYTQQLVNTLIVKSGLHAKKASIHVLTFSANSMQLLATHCTNIEELDLRVALVKDVKRCLQSLPLVRLKLLASRYDNEAPAGELTAMIQSCERLRCVKCADISMPNAAEVLSTMFNKANASRSKRFRVKVRRDMLETWLLSQVKFDTNKWPRNLIVNGAAIINRHPLQLASEE